MDVAQFTKQAAKPRTPLRTNVAPSRPAPDTLTHEAGHGFTRDVHSELFLLGASYLFGKPTFYETPSDRDRRFIDLVHQADADWLRGFIPYLRRNLNIRTASLVAAAEYAAAGKPAPREVVKGALARADEPAEMVGYWLLRHGRPIPKGVKRGVADALTDLVSEYAALKYAGWGQQTSMADAIQLTHPQPRDDVQRDLFRYLLAKRRGAGTVPGETLTAHRERERLREIPHDQRKALLTEDPDALNRAGATWEWVAGTLLSGGMDAEAWAHVIPEMGVMALLRNLRNFDDAGLSGASAQVVKERLADPDAVRLSRALPLRFLQAWQATSSMRWGEAIEAGLEASLSNVPHLTGRTLALTDVSGSMTWGDAPWRTAAAFAAATVRASDDGWLVAYSSRSAQVPVGAILRTIDNVEQSPAFGGGTRTVEAVAESYRWADPKPDRIVVVTDEQAFGSHHTAWQRVAFIPCPIYTWNVQGYKAGWTPSGADNRYTLGGLSDAGFTFMDTVESRQDGAWPWQV